VLYRSHIDPVVLGMRAEPFDLDRPVFENDPGNKTVFVSHDIEDHAVVGHDARVPIHLFQLVEIREIAVQQLMGPFQQRRFCQRMRLAVFKQRSSGDDVENVGKRYIKFTNGKLIKSYPVGVCFDFRPRP
jgi:hypothetical protein